MAGQPQAAPPRRYWHRRPAATLDQVADGRLILGVGIVADVPNIRHEFTAADVPYEKRVGRLLEGLRAAAKGGVGGGRAADSCYRACEGEGVGAGSGMN